MLFIYSHGCAKHGCLFQRVMRDASKSDPSERCVNPLSAEDNVIHRECTLELFTLYVIRHGWCGTQCLPWRRRANTCIGFIRSGVPKSCHNCRSIGNSVRRDRAQRNSPNHSLSTIANRKSPSLLKWGKGPISSAAFGTSSS
jgi:hypothetical protein